MISAWDNLARRGLEDECIGSANFGSGPKADMAEENVQPLCRGPFEYPFLPVQ